MASILPDRDRLDPLDMSTDAKTVERMVPGTDRWIRGYPDHIQRYEFVTRFLQPGMTVLDAGCGCGYGAAYLADKGASKVIAADISREALEIGKQQFARDNISWVHDDCETLAESSRHGGFDLIVNFENIEHLSDPSRFVARASGLLKPGGTLISSTPNRIRLNAMQGRPLDSPPTNPHHVQEFSETEFRNLLKQGFKNVDLWYQCKTIDLNGMSKVIEAVNALWSNPLVRLGRAIQRGILRRPIAKFDLGASVPQWQIVGDNPGEYSIAMFVAVCTSPSAEMIAT